MNYNSHNVHLWIAIQGAGKYMYQSYCIKIISHSFSLNAMIETCRSKSVHLTKSMALFVHIIYRGHCLRVSEKFASHRDIVPDEIK